MDIHEDDVSCESCPWVNTCRSGVSCESSYELELTNAWKEMSYHRFIEDVLDTAWSEYDLFIW